MTKNEAIEKYVIPAIERTWNEKNCKKILEALERESCEDAISREDALMALTGEWTESRAEILPKAIKRIQKLPSVNPKSDWIPVSDRLPEDGTEVFVYMFDPPSPFIAWIEDTRWYTEDFEVDRENDPIAWMPLAEPYKAESEEQ